VWVGNLSRYATKQQLCNFMAIYGPVTGARITDTVPHKPRCAIADYMFR
jgi:hypothetical protein